MSKLEDLIQKLCPNGVEWKELGELGILFSGLNGKSKKDFQNGNQKFITYMNVFSNLELDVNVNDKVFISDNEKQNVLLYGDVIFTASSESREECGISSVMTKQVNEKLFLNSFCFGFRFNDINIMLPGFSKYLFRSDFIRKQIVKTASGVTRFNISKEKMKQIKIPIPPLEIQEEIVHILDSFTELTNELTNELTARRKQYEFYRDSLLTFGDEVEWKELGEVCEILNNKRKPVTKKDRVIGEYPYYGANGIQDYVRDYIFDGIFLLIGEDGSVLKEDNSPILNWATGKIWVNNHAHVLSEKKGTLLRYLYHVLQTISIVHLVKGTPPKLNQQNLRSIKLPLPPLSEQERIVSILDKFDSLCNDITKGLPAEIEARKKQYEYYRDKLLTFKDISENK